MKFDYCQGKPLKLKISIAKFNSPRVINANGKIISIPGSSQISLLVRSNDLELVAKTFFE
jgi:hypothetical protein